MSLSFQWIFSQLKNMHLLVSSWANINSHSLNPKGLETMLLVLKKAFRQLNPDEETTISLANGNALLLQKRKKAPLQVFLGGHIDTVFPLESSFQKAFFSKNKILKGPGVADMKGGLAILLKALTLFEYSPLAPLLGWKIFLNPDEEMGSPYSSAYLKKYAKPCDFALFFEPSLPDGSLIHQRKGSYNYIATAKGKAAHYGRDPRKGKNAIVTLARWISSLEETAFNIGWIQGGKGANIVPDQASCSLNFRSYKEAEIQQMQQQLLKSAKKHHITLHLKSFRPPKPFDSKTQALFKILKECGKYLHQPLTCKKTGGVCDGNLTSALGIPTIDSLGAIGGQLHTTEEYIEWNSLAEKACLVALLLMKIALKRRE